MTLQSQKIKLKDIEGSFDRVPYMEEILETVSMFHIGNGQKNHDGSMGIIDITPRQLRDVMAYWFSEGLDDH